jgi:hypothetical protein
VDTPAGARLALSAAPSPFRKGTTLAFALARAGRVRVAVFDARGRKVVDLLDATRPAGPGAVRWEAGGIPAGVYFARLDAGGETITRNLILLD